VALFMCGPAFASPQADCNQSANHALRIEGCTEVVRQNPRDAVAYYRRGMAHARTGGNFEKALADFSKAIEIDPNYAEAFHERGIAYREMKDYNSAIADHTKAIELDPNKPDSYFNRGLAFYGSGNFDRAIADYTRAIEIDPKDAEVFINRGNVYRSLSDYDRAIADYTKAIEIDPKSALAYRNRARIHFLKGANFAAMADHVNAIEIDPIGALPHLVVPVILLLIVIGILRLLAGAQAAKFTRTTSPRPSEQI
jgi:tetratricopeptide (TPR) repeat protein